jgi:hypothetical protein
VARKFRKTVLNTPYISGVSEPMRCIQLNHRSDTHPPAKLKEDVPIYPLGSKLTYRGNILGSRVAKHIKESAKLLRWNN